jgi:integrase
MMQSLKLTGKQERASHMLPVDGSAMKLNKTTVRGLQLPAGKPEAFVWDDDVRGFGVRLRAGGKRVWVVQYRVGAKQRRVTLGDVKKLDPDRARAAARERLAEVTLGRDPQAEKVSERAKAAVTLGAVVETYLAGKRAMLRPKSFQETDRYLRKSWKSLHGIPIHRIERRTVAARMAEISADNGPAAATRARAALSGLFSWAVREGLAESNPVIGTNQPAEPRSRSRVLSEAELREVWRACRGDDHGRIVRLLILTGQRRDEVGAMAWAELDLDRATWCIPGGRTKNHLDHTLPLPPLVMSIINDAPGALAAGEDTIPPNGVRGKSKVFGRGENGFGGWSNAKAALDRRIFEARKRFAERTREPAEDVKPIAAWTLHDIRRSVATHMAELGVLPHVIEALLNHVSGHKAGVAGIYNRSRYESEVKAALAMWADRVGELVGDAERKIVPMRRTRG